MALPYLLMFVSCGVSFQHKTEKIGKNRDRYLMLDGDKQSLLYIAKINKQGVENVEDTTIKNR